MRQDAVFCAVSSAKTIQQVGFLGKHPQDGVIRGFDGDQALYQILNTGFDSHTTASGDVFDALKGSVVQM
jgi:hypothetical protein